MTTSTIHTEGGAAIDGAVTAGQDFIGRDQINISIHAVVQAAPVQALPPSNLYLINFTRPLTEQQRSQIEQALGYCIGKTVTVHAEFNELRDLGPQVVALVDSVNLTAHEWQTLPILVNPTGFAPAAVCLLSELHGRMGHFPAVVRLRPEPHSKTPAYSVAEIINLQALRDAARKRSQG